MKTMSILLVFTMFASTLLFADDRNQRVVRRNQLKTIQEEYAECSKLIYQQYQDCIEENGGVINEFFFKKPCKQQAMFFTQQARFAYQQLVNKVGYTQKDYILDKVDDFWTFLGYEL